MPPSLRALAVLVTVASPALAAPPDASSIVARMRAALQPEKPMVRRLTFAISADQESSQVIVGEARKRVNGAGRILFVGLAPEAIRGTAYLVQEGSEAQNVQWVYIPAVRRVRTTVSPEAYTAFLNSDFTYADLGFVGTDATYTVLGEEDLGGRKTYKIQGIPRQGWYYGRWVTWVGADNGLPLQREIYDPANDLWKRERWNQVSVVEGIPTAFRHSMEDVQTRTRTDIIVTGVDYEASLPDALFDPAQLPSAGSAAVWSAVGR